MLWMALSRVVVETWVDCCAADLGAPRPSEAIEYMDMRLLAMATVDGDGDVPTRTVTSRFYRLIRASRDSTGVVGNLSARSGEE